MCTMCQNNADTNIPLALATLSVQLATLRAK